ncbi:MAG: NFACT family protein [Candidatus Caldarchaeum sp.]|nr:NFACT family protein [Candidatus Caldarchaeum sp.]
MIQLNSHELKLLVNECREKVVDSYIRNVYQITPKALAFKLYKPGGQTGELWAVAGYAVFYASKTVSKQPTPSKPVVELRKQLVGKKITGISQVEGERIIAIAVDGQTLYVECLPPGNIVLVKDGRISWLLEKFESKDRVLKVGESYVFPPSKGLRDLTVFSENWLKDLPRRASVVSVVSRDLGLGGKFGEEIVFRAGIDKSTKLSEINTEQMKKLAAAVDEVLDEINTPTPRVYRKNGDLVPSAFELKTLQTASYTKTETFGEAVQYAYLMGLEADKQRAFEREKAEISGKLRRDMENRLYALQNVEKKTAEVQSFLDKILKVSPLIEIVWNEPNTVERIAAETGLEVELVNDRLAIRSAEQELVFRKGSSLYKELGRLYDELKTLRKTAQKLGEEVAAIKKEIESVESRVFEAKADALVLVKVEKKRRPFREFVTSGGYRLLMGKDARTNEALLKKHLDKDDLVLHAEITGSPATVIKNGSSAPTSDVEEAAQATACYSRAWREKFGNVSVYAVKADQISFSPPSGQFLPKGSFMVYGRKTYFVSELRLAVVYAEDVPQVVPYLTALRKGQRFIEIRPGDTAADVASRVILEKLNVEVSPENLQLLSSQIPFGRCMVLDNLING